MAGEDGAYVGVQGRRNDRYFKNGRSNFKNRTPPLREAEYTSILALQLSLNNPIQVFTGISTIDSIDINDNSRLLA